MTDPKTLKEAVNLGREHCHILGQVAGINKAIRALNRGLMSSDSASELSRIDNIINDLMAESRLLLKEAEQLTKPVTEEEKKQILNKPQNGNSN